MVKMQSTQHPDLSKPKWILESRQMFYWDQTGWYHRKHWDSCFNRNNIFVVNLLFNFICPLKQTLCYHNKLSAAVIKASRDFTRTLECWDEPGLTNKYHKFIISIHESIPVNLLKFSTTQFQIVWLFITELISLTNGPNQIW